MKKIFCVLLCALCIAIIFSGCSAKEIQIEITMSDVIRPVDLTDNDLSYGMDYEHYEKKDEYDFYNCVFKVTNNSKYDVLNVYLNQYNSDNFCIDTKYGAHRYTIRTNETEYVAGVISIKKGVNETEKKSIVNEIKRTASVAVDVGYAYENKVAEVEKTITKTFDISDEDYFKQEVYYPDGWGSSVIK